MRYFIEKIVVCIVTILLMPCSSHAQESKADSLKEILQTEKTDTAKISTLSKLCFELKKNNDFAGVLNYSQQAILLSEKAIPKANAEDKNKIKKSMASVFTTRGIVLRTQSEYSKALEEFSKSLKLSEELNDKKGIGNVIGSIANVYYYLGQYPKALEQLYKSLQILESIHEKIPVASTLSNIGNIYSVQNENDKALTYYYKALGILEELGGNDQRICSILNNIGVTYQHQKKYDKALEQDFKTLKIFEKNNDKKGMGAAYTNIGYVYLDQGRYSEALEELLTAIKIQEELGDKSELAQSFFYVSAVYFSQKEYKKAEEYDLRSLDIANQIHVLSTIKEAHEQLSLIYDKLEKYDKAEFHYKAFIAARDSLHNDENTKKSVRAEMSFDFEKKQTIEKEEQEKKDAVAAESLKRQKLISYSVVAGLTLVLLFSFLLFNRFRIIRKQKQIIEKQKNIVDEKNKEITDSIQYAKRIQHALLASDSMLKKNLPEHFIVYKPKDIVSGDFYWANIIDNKFAIITADCTGHGVPGAFMSLLNISYLNEAIVEKRIDSPEKILDYVRGQIIHSLSSEDTEIKNTDGMDAALCVYDFKGLWLRFACANNPLWLIRNEELIEYKPDKIPVGSQYGEEKAFTLNTIGLRKGDIIYTFTDGYADQFGGIKGKKFKYRQFQDLLIANHKKEMPEQKRILEKTIEDWRGNLEQVDDILVIGIRI